MFLTPLELTPVGNGEWRLTKELDYGLQDGHKIRVPQGFRTDLASIPRLLRLFIQVNGEHRQAAVLHDYLYSRKGQLIFRKYSRANCDWLLYVAMIESGVPRWKAKLMYLAVRAGGWAVWND